MSTTEEDRAKKTIRVGSRKSELALTQTKHVIARLQKLNPDVVYEIHTMTTVGDRVLNKSLPKIGEKSLFTKDLEDALRTGGVDFVVHSLKDLPTALPVGMAIGAVLEREDPRDALVLNERHRGSTLASLPRGSLIGTSSLRRSAQLARYYRHLNVCDIRGNLNTRLAKLDADASKFAGIILAQAGLVRMGWNERIDQVIEPSEILYAVGQGALAVECRSNDEYILGMLAKLCHLETQCRILTERSFLRTLGGGCSAPVAVRTELKRQADSDSSNNNNSNVQRKRSSVDTEQGKFQLQVEGAVWSLDGKTEIRTSGECTLDLSATDHKCVIDTTPPKKKAKVNDEDNGANGGGGDHHANDGNGAAPSDTTKPLITGCPIDHEQLQGKRKSPEIIRDTDVLLPGCSKDGSRLNLSKFIDIHGELFKKCPYSSELTKIVTEARKSTSADGNGVDDELQGNTIIETNAKKDDGELCPSTHFPVGQEVMGDCPFVSTEEKVDLLLAGAMAGCPMAAKTKPTKDAETRTDLKPTNDGNGDRRHDGTTEGNKSILPPTDKCPFLAAKVLDYNENLDRRQLGPEPKLEDNSEQLFCGMHRHAFIELTVFERCEKLGYDLAHDLIAKGALAVMKCAQNEIHSKVGTS
uniref:hydroxymethylbilane synthase n=1 Tax=Anopheles darlingi TaxID=43151 RepID=A0A2M4CRD1_ANODA